MSFAEVAQAELQTLKLDVTHDMGPGCCCDVFQPHGGSWLSTRQRKLATRARGIRFLKRVLDPLLPRHRDFHRLAERQYVNKRQVHVAVSRTVAEDLTRLHGIEPQRIRIVYNGVDTDHFSPGHRDSHRGIVRRRLGISERAIVLLIMAHNFRLKGVPALLRATKQLQSADEQVHLLVVGGHRLGRWRRTAERLGVADAVTFTGTVDQTVPFYAAADIYVHPTFYDPCSLVLLEAAASGLPLITARRYNGAAELLCEGVDALLISDPANADEIVTHVRSLFHEPQRRLDGQRGATNGAETPVPQKCQRDPGHLPGDGQLTVVRLGRPGNRINTEIVG